MSNTSTPMAGVPDDFLSHQDSWRAIIANTVQTAPPSSHDKDDKGYYAHELKAFDRAYAELHAKMAEQQRAIAEYKAVLSDPNGLSFLMNWHDLQQVEKEASDMSGGSNENRRKELKEMGRRLIEKENDFECFSDDNLRVFGFSDLVKSRQTLSVPRGLLAMTKDEIQRANWSAVLGQLLEARKHLQKDGSRHTGLDGAIGIAEQGALLPDNELCPPRREREAG